MEPETTHNFLHIPKSGGTTMNLLLYRLYRFKNVYYINPESSKPIEEYALLSLKERAGYDLIMGHMPFGIHKLVPHRCVYFTILRDPIKRALSTYHFIFQTPHHYLYDRVVKTNMSFEDFVYSQITTEMNNHQTRLLSGIDEARVPFGHCTRDMFDVAKENLQKHFVVAGLLERYDETLILLRRTLRWRMPFYVRRNITTKHAEHSEIGPNVIRAIQDDNALDTELHQYASKRFDEMMRLQSSSFQRELLTFRFLNRWYGRLYRAY